MIHEHNLLWVVVLVICELRRASGQIWVEDLASRLCLLKTSFMDTLIDLKTVIEQVTA